MSFSRRKTCGLTTIFVIFQIFHATPADHANEASICLQTRYKIQPIKCEFDQKMVESY